ncbi:MAG TPA: PEP/pyruvate-binding domain-containing protein [Polyangiaceae bacterium]|nr:PEP/pyruvate-binding domain-containing protein [Polyangiaceae bacterium]
MAKQGRATRGGGSGARAGGAGTGGWLLPLEVAGREGSLHDAASLGGKAARLAWLVRHGFDVPETWVIPAAAFAAALRGLPPPCEPRSLLRVAMGRNVYSRAAEARQEILRVALPDDLEAELEALWERWKVPARWGFAVRSSATCEDGALVSMAGLAETKLGVRGGRGLAEAVREVWASIASGRALAYLAAHGVRDVGMAVVVQRMVEADAAGVMFTRVHGPAAARGERVINVGFGLGAPVVDGVTSPDMLRLARDGRVVSETVARKPIVTVVGDAGVEEREAPAPDAPALGPEHLRQLADVAAKLEGIEDVAWDVEFACQGDRVMLVQARPVTGRGFPEGGDAETVWSNVNVGEALPGVATPFTWSIAGAFSEAGFHSAFGALGCSVPKNAKLVGNVHGRFYLNLSQFMRIAAQVPGLDPRTLMGLGGGSGADLLEREVSDVSRRGFYARLPVTATRLLREQLRLDADVDAFEALAEKTLRAHVALDLAILPDEGLATRMRDVQAFLERSGTVMLTCASSSLGTHVALRTLLARVAGADADRLAQELVRGIRDLESARPGIGVLRVADLARSEPAARDALLLESTRSLDAVPEGPTKRALARFLELYGDRAVREAELSTPRWREDPRTVLTMLRVALRGETREVEVTLARSRAEADAEMRNLQARLGLPTQTLVRHLVARAQKAARLRERMRAWVTRVLGMIRDVALDADRRLLRLSPELADDFHTLQRAGSPLATVQSVFLLSVDEIMTALRSSRRDLAPLVRARRAELARDLSRPDPPPTFVGLPPSVLLPPAGGRVLAGIAASAGVVEGRARVLMSPAQMTALQPGEILVVHTTDVGWTPLFLLAAGIVTELGGPLSHAAVVAREFGVPSVVNVERATLVVKTGDRLRVDGDRGTVEILPEAAAS